MTKPAPISLDSFDPEVLAAAREVAKRAGVPLESWIESVVAPGQPQPTTQRKRPEPAPEPAEAERMQAGQARLESAARAIPTPAEAPPPESRDARPDEAPPAAATSLDAALAAMARRLDALDRSLNEEREASRAAAARMIGEIEARLAATLRPEPAPVLAPAEAVTERLADIERRMGEIATQAAAPRPIGRRGKPLANEMRDAVAEVRRRQRELEEGAADAPAPAAPPTGSPTGSAAEAARPAPEGAVTPSPAIAELQRETSRLRDSLGSLATGRDVGALEQAMRALVADIQRAHEPAELAAIAAPIELMRVQVERLAEDVAANVHARVAGEVERLASKVDGALAGAAPTFADQHALDGVFRELDEIRRLVAALAGPERIQSLAQGVQAISAQIAQLQRGKEAEVAELKPLLEEIRSELRAPQESRNVSREASREILGRFEALADRMDRVAAHPVGDLMGRLESLGETLRQPPAAPKDFDAIRGMLTTLAEKVDRVSTGGPGLDALEQHVVALASRLDAPKAADPALARLERTMGELVAQVSTLKQGVALAEAGAARGDAFDGLRADLAEMRASQRSADQRLQATMDGVQALLSRLSDQLDRGTTATMTSAGALAAASTAVSATVSAALPEAPRTERTPREGAARGRGGEKAIEKSDEKPAEKTIEKALARPAIRDRAVRAEAPTPEAILFADELLEPGAGRPGPTARPAAPEAAVAGGDIKTSFIAAARRAAQAAQAEAEAEQPLTARLRERMGGPAARGAAGAAESEGPVARMRGAFEKRRRTLVLGLAAVVLALGAYQAFLAGGTGSAPEGGTIAAAPQAEAEARALDKAGKAEGDAQATAPSSTPAPTQAAGTPPDPTTTQALAAPARPEEGVRKPAAGAVAHSLPQVASMAGLAPDLAGLPPALATLKQSALDGDGAAIWDLAGRAAEGRGMVRDLAVAAKLYERLGGAGYAPAQFKIGNAYEKGSGVVRDIAQAKGWYGRAADAGNARAMHNLAVLHAENPAANGRPDFATAAESFRRAAEHGVRDSQYNLAVLYARGLGTGQDLVQSYLWFSAAAAQGDEEAGRKRDEVAAKLSPADLARGKGLVAAFKAKAVDPSANEPPAPKPAAAPPVSLMGAPSPVPHANPFQKRAGV